MAKQSRRRQPKKSPARRPARAVRNRRLTKAEASADKAIRDKYTSRPSLESLVASGDYTATIATCDYVELLRVMARLKQARAAQKISLSEMAARTGIDKGALSKLENGIFDNPTIATLQRYAKAIGKEIVVGIVDLTETPPVAGTPATT